MEVEGDGMMRGLKISVADADRDDVWILLRELVFRRDPWDGVAEFGMKIVAVGVGGNEIGWCLFNGGG